ncbi:hypothetical protein BS78_02G155700 [Paspalum vaginatum]|nr:hypothetical protein BS78_02G155700 [Paspalum vaginatum]
MCDGGARALQTEAKHQMRTVAIAAPQRRACSRMQRMRALMVREQHPVIYWYVKEQRVHALQHAGWDCGHATMQVARSGWRRPCVASQVFVRRLQPRPRCSTKCLEESSFREAEAGMHASTSLQ